VGHRIGQCTNHKLPAQSISLLEEADAKEHGPSLGNEERGE
jgi:hypothetical protein